MANEVQNIQKLTPEEFRALSAEEKNGVAFGAGKLYQSAVEKDPTVNRSEFLDTAYATIAKDPDALKKWGEEYKNEMAEATKRFQR